MKEPNTILLIHDKLIVLDEQQKKNLLYLTEIKNPQKGFCFGGNPSDFGGVNYDSKLTHNDKSIIAANPARKQITFFNLSGKLEKVIDFDKQLAGGIKDIAYNKIDNTLVFIHDIFFDSDIIISDINGNLIKKFEFHKGGFEKTNLKKVFTLGENILAMSENEIFLFDPQFNLLKSEKIHYMRTANLSDDFIVTVHLNRPEFALRDMANFHVIKSINIKNVLGLSIGDNLIYFTADFKVWNYNLDTEIQKQIII